MCDDELEPPAPDLTEDQWSALDPAVARPVPLSRRALLTGAAAGMALAALPGTHPARAATARPGTAAFPLPAGPDRTGQYRVLVTGDAGTGTAEQYAVAAAARDVCAAEGVGLAVGLGDNLYENGPEDAGDPEFTEKFEGPNAGIDVPWLMVLGNHDCSGLIPGSGGRPARGDHEVAYSARSPRWYMPARHYSVALPSARADGAPLVEFFALDTNPVASTVAQTDPHYHWNGPYMRGQRDWLDRALGASRATWKVVLGHHPYVNNGKHGSAGSYDGFTVGHYTSGVHLRELYEEVVCGRADLILSGHDHTMQVLEPTPRSRGTRQIVCGAAGKSGDGRRYGSHPARWQDFAARGFMVLGVSAAACSVDVYTVDTRTRTAHLAHTATWPRAAATAR
ncbi:metallophosphoesterase [Streptomyces sp. NPDC012888]|uniref:metallophosphoesterase n=1 Tax=Streptomyces sp. NPDC012888 TaxID=3364855 RepID=UPI0036BDC6AA